MRAFAVAVSMLVVCLGACAADDDEPIDPLEGPRDPARAARAYVADPTVRRAALEASVGVADTDYGRVRLAHYGLDWEDAPVYAPVVRALRVPARAGDAAPPLAPEGPVATIDAETANLAAYVAAGREAFERYPVQLDPHLSALREGADVARRYGLDVDDDGVVRGAVEVHVPDGRWLVALTCAACHSSRDADGRYVAGLTNDRLALAELLGDARWAPGTMDVSADVIENPVRPPDLRPLRFQSRMHHSGNLANGRVARMVRIETLIAERLAFQARPDRAVVAAMGLYLESLGDSLTEPAGEPRARASFDRHCGGCHRGPELSGPIVDVALVGTDALATMGARATGGYRAPSLLGVGDRGALLHDGSASRLRGLLRLQPSAHEGHPFGTELDEDERMRIAEWLGAR